jgi:hypothetical protein
VRSTITPVCIHYGHDKTGTELILERFFPCSASSLRMFIIYEGYDMENVGVEKF